MVFGTEKIDVVQLFIIYWYDMSYIICILNIHLYISKPRTLDVLHKVNDDIVTSKSKWLIRLKVWLNIFKKVCS
jgi:hypothetical protein